MTWTPASWVMVRGTVTVTITVTLTPTLTLTLTLTLIPIKKTANAIVLP